MIRSRWRALGPAMAAALLLIAFGCRLPAAPPYDAPPDAAASIEQVADRLRGHLDDGSLIEGRWVAWHMHSPLFWTCRGEGSVPPLGVPAYAAVLRVAELPSSLRVRFWVLTPDGAVAAARAARGVADQCVAGPSDAVALPFSRAGWSGTRLMNTEVEITEDGAEFTTADIVAARGHLLVEVWWSWPVEQGGQRDPYWIGQGMAAVTGVLTAVGGRRADITPVPEPQPGVSVLAAALPPPTAYGADVKLWAGLPEQLDLACTYTVDKPLPATVPTVSRILAGRVSVREDILHLPGAATAEQTRRMLITADSGRANTLGEPGRQPCDKSDVAEPVRIPYRKEPLTRGGWHGELESFAVRRARLPAVPTHWDSVAHVALAVRRGAVVVRLVWQGPAETDLAGTLRAGRAALMRTLDRLPAT
ncbi:hypothetical protein [Nonomuraea sp. NPDC049709]|uniref:hypothetical protein n=1 Tax=Nonomuraea sp. NPDC049709 TaxID=3154736 RepID=UPI0034381C3A